MSVSKIKGTLPEGEFRNGLDAIADQLADNPAATARIRRIEAVAPVDEDTARKLLVRGYEYRCGKTTLDLETEAELRNLRGDR